MWGFQDSGVIPDIVTMGKPIGDGHPLAAVVTTPAIAAEFARMGLAPFGDDDSYFTTVNLPQRTPIIEDTWLALVPSADSIICSAWRLLPDRAPPRTSVIRGRILPFIRAAAVRPWLPP